MPSIERAVILSVSAGAGHMRAARAIKDALLEENPRADVTILDTFRYTNPFLDKIVLGTYMEIIKVSPVVYGYLYRRAEKGQPLSGLAKQEFNRLMSMVTAPRLLSFLEQKKPQVVICTHPFPLGIMSGLRQKGRLKSLLCGVITDFTVHPYWIFNGVDCYMVGAWELAEQFEEYSITPRRVYATGIPIDGGFASALQRREEIRGAFGIKSETPTILVMGGGLGMGPLVETVKLLASGDRACRIMVVAGNNNQLKARLDRLASDMAGRVMVFGYVENIHELMTACSLLVGKAGGLTCAEALAMGMPMFFVDPLPGQEERNVEFLTGAGAAQRAQGTRDLAERVFGVLANPEKLRAMSGAASILGRPGAARETVKIMSGLYDRRETEDSIQIQKLS